jgi:arsenite/tail-anchored protein-transporting ATPase
VLLTDDPRPLRFLSGKGGVGKTTLAAAGALRLAAEGAVTLLISTDPAHSTGDLLAARLGPDPTRVTERLWAVELDAEKAAAAHVARIKEAAAASVDLDLLPTVERHLDLATSSPGTVESALLDRLADLLEDAADRFDRVVVDTAPTGHTLRLLALPAVLTAWVEGLARQREKVAGFERMARNLAGDDPGPDADPILGRLRERRARLRAAASRFRDDARFWLVVTPERLAVAETVRASEALAGAGLTIGGLLVNRVLPENPTDAFLASRRRDQDACLADLAGRLPRHRQVRIPQLPRDVVDRAQLQTLAGWLPPDW